MHCLTGQNNAINYLRKSNFANTTIHTIMVNREIRDTETVMISSTKTYSKIPNYLSEIQSLNVD